MNLQQVILIIQGDEGRFRAVPLAAAASHATIRKAAEGHKEEPQEVLLPVRIQGPHAQQ